jgi:hypothetical protein
MVDLSLADSFLAHQCVLILGWLFILALTFTFVTGDGRLRVAKESDVKPTESSAGGGTRNRR